MTKKITLLLSFIVFTCVVSAQEIKTNSLENQFSNVIEKSNNYQEYKVVKKVKLHSLRKNVLDTVASLEQTITTINSKNEEQLNTIASLNNELKVSQSDLSISKEKENGMVLFGVLTQKSTYNTILWSVIGILLASLLFIFYKFKNSNSITKEANFKLSETEEEFDTHKKNTLEREQQLRRKLQDEINKNRSI